MDPRSTGPIDAELITAVDTYLSGALLPDDPALEIAWKNGEAAGLPMRASVAPLQGRFLQLLVWSLAAERVLEVGTLGGYSSICLARGLADPGTGRVLTLELDANRARVARATIRQVGLSDVIQVRTGPALDSLQQLVRQSVAPYDFIFVDADKDNNPTYFELAVQLSRPGTLIVFDNVVRGGDVLNEHSPKPAVQGVRKLLAAIQHDRRVDATALTTVTRKGLDGMAVVTVL